MTASGFDSALAFVFKWEGGLSDDPDDPGGRTNRGITQSEYDRWREQRGLAPRDVAAVGDDELMVIYYTNYWKKARCDVLAEKEDLLQFDTAVNMGVARAVNFIQAAAGTAVDGVFGEATLQAVNAFKYLPLVISYCDQREACYRGLAQKHPKLTKFLGGWLNRLNSVRHEIGVPGCEGPQLFDFGGLVHVAKAPD